MKFKITSRTADNSEHSYLYDNITNLITNLEGEEVNVKSPDNDYLFRAKEYVPEEKVRFLPKSKHLHKLKIQLGFKCNFKCAYCPQRIYEKQIPIQIDSPHLVPIFLERLKKTGITTKEVLLMGGEPFVYIKLLRPLVKGLRELYPAARFHIVTNASLLDKKIADWCSENRINLTVSHDGPLFSAYRDRKDILDNPNVLEGIRHYLDKARENRLELQINSVIYPENSELAKIPEFFEKKIGRPVRVVFETIVKLNENTVNGVAKYDEVSANLLISEMILGGIRGGNNGSLDCLRRMGIAVARRIYFKESLNQIQYSCKSIQPDFMAVDLAGHLLACHSHAYIRTGYGKMEDFAIAKTDIQKRWSERPHCRECPFLVSCLGGCPLQNGKSHEIACVNLKIWHMGLFLIAWHVLFQEIITDIEPLSEHSDGVVL